jgi:hypothetical protein
MQSYTKLKETGQAYINENITRYLQSIDADATTSLKSSLSNPLLERFMIIMTILFTDILLLFTIRMPPFIGFGRLNHLSYIWNKLRI